MPEVLVRVDAKPIAEVDGQTIMRGRIILDFIDDSGKLPPVPLDDAGGPDTDFPVA